MLSLDSAAKCPLHIVLNASLSLGRQVVCPWDFFEGELGPYDEVNNLLIDAVGPVVVQDLYVIWKY